MYRPQVTCSVEKGVMTIRIDNPELDNGLTWEGLNQFADCYEKLRDDDSIKVAVITGNDQFFYTGGRVEAKNPGESEKYSAAISRLDSLRAANAKPLVAAVKGTCLKAGMGLITSCDFAIARKGVEFGFPEVRMGGVPMMVMAETINVMPRKKAFAAYLTSWNFSAEEALAMGFLNEVVDDEDFDATVAKYVDVFLNTLPELVAMTKKAFNTMSTIDTYGERAAFAMKMLREEVLPTMAKIKTQYNIR